MQELRSTLTPPRLNSKGLVMPAYSYARCLKNAYKVNWKIDDLLGDRQFDRVQELAARQRLSGGFAGRPASPPRRSAS